MNAQVEDFLYRGREEHRRAAGLENVVALVRGGGTLGNMVVTGHGDDAAELGGTRHVGVLEDIGSAVDARPLAVPDAEHAIELVGALRREAQLLRAPQRGRRQLLVDARLEHDVLRLEVLAGFPQRLVVAAERRAAIAADEAGRVLAVLPIAQALQHRQLDEGLHAAHEGAAVIERVLVVERDRFEGLADVFGKGRVHVSCLLAGTGSKRPFAGWAS